MPNLPSPAAMPSAQIPPAETPRSSSLMGLAVAVFVVAGLYFGREVLIPITLAILLSFVLAPLVGLLRRIHVPRAPAVLLSVLLALGVILMLGGLIGTQIASLAREIPHYQTTIQHKISEVQGLTIGQMSERMRSIGHVLQRASRGQTTPPIQLPVPGQPPEPGQKPVPVEVHQPNPSPLIVAERVLAPLLHPLATTGIILIVAIFILLQQQDLRDRFIRLFGSDDLHRTTVAMDDAARRLSRYFLTQLGINASFGLIIATGLFFIGVPSPVLWGILAGLLRFVPYIGSIIAGFLPVALAAAVDPGWSMMLWTVALFLTVEPVMGQVVEPMVYGHSTGLSPFAVIIAAIFWSWIWGPIGLLLSTPLTLCLVVMGRHIERMEFLDVLLGDRPALTPIENFYQRMLAADPDEALGHAELLLKERSLSSYYDEVALKGLQLAATDAERGVLTAPQVQSIRESIEALVEDLDAYDDVDPAPGHAANAPAMPPDAERKLPKQPPPDGEAPEIEARSPEWRTEAPVLCIAGRGPLDEAAAAMLAQLLRKHGLGARLLSHNTVSRTNLPMVDFRGVGMVCISYLNIAGSPSHLRYLVKRLRQRLGSAPILVGLWPLDDPILKDSELREELGADYYVASLRDAVNACLEAARLSARSQAAKTDEAPRASDAAELRLSGPKAEQVRPQVRPA